MNCEFYDNLELACVRRLPVRVGRLDGEIIEGQATDLGYDSDRRERLLLSVGGEVWPVLIDEIASLAICRSGERFEPGARSAGMKLGRGCEIAVSEQGEGPGLCCVSGFGPHASPDVPVVCFDRTRLPGALNLSSRGAQPAVWVVAWQALVRHLRVSCRPDKPN